MLRVGIRKDITSEKKHACPQNQLFGNTETRSIDVISLQSDHWINYWNEEKWGWRFRLSLSFPYMCVQELEHQEFENMVVTIDCEFLTTSWNNIITSACTCLKVQKKGKIMWAQQSLHVGPEAHDLLILGPQYHKRYTYPYVVVQ